MMTAEVLAHDFDDERQVTLQLSMMIVFCLTNWLDFIDDDLYSYK